MDTVQVRYSKQMYASILQLYGTVLLLLLRMATGSSDVRAGRLGRPSQPILEYVVVLSSLYMIVFLESVLHYTYTAYSVQRTISMC